MKKYSKILRAESGREYRYNYSNSTLEFIAEHTVLDATGLNIDNWNDSNEYWTEMYDEEIAQEVHCMMDFEEDMEEDVLHDVVMDFLTL